MFEYSGKNRKILEALKENSRLSTGKISKKTRIPATTIFNRIKKMEKDGIIKKYTVDVDYKKIGIGVRAFVFLSQDYKALTEGKEEILFKGVSKDPHVVDIFKISGRFDVLMMIRAKDIEDLDNFLSEMQKGEYGIIKTETMVVLKQAAI